MSSAGLRELAPGLHVLEAPQRFMGLELGARMTVLQLGGGVLVHSPVAVDPASLDRLGQLDRAGHGRWVMAPNLLHHLYVGPWIDAGYAAWGAPGLANKREDLSFAGELSSGAEPFGEEVELHALTCLPMTNEVVALHRPSRTLLTCDLVFNFSPEAPLLTRVAMRGMAAYPGCSSSLLERVKMKRDAARLDLETILSWDFDRVIMAHGEVVERGGPEAVRRAFSWLWR